MPANPKKEPDAELQELEVREVSIVDRPANLRPWYVVKRDAGVVTIQEENMPKKPTEKGDQDLVSKIRDALGDEVVEVMDLLDLTKEQDDSSKPGAGDDEEVNKVSKADALKKVEAAVGKLMPIVNAAKSGEVKPEVADAIKAIAGDLRDLAKGLSSGSDEDDSSDEETDKGAIEGVITKALERLMKVVTLLKADGDEIPGDLPKEIKAIAAMLMAAAAQASGGKEEEEQKSEDDDEADDDEEEGGDKETDLRAFVVGKSDDDPEVLLVRAEKGADASEVLAQVFKAGAKIKRARLSKLMEAYKILGVILTEVGALKPEKKKTQKVAPPPPPAPPPVDAGLLEMMKSTQDTLASVSATMEKLGQRIATLESGEGTPEGDGEPVKKKISLWGGKILGPPRGE